MMMTEEQISPEKLENFFKFLAISQLPIDEKETISELVETGILSGAEFDKFYENLEQEVKSQKEFEGLVQEVAEDVKTLPARIEAEQKSVVDEFVAERLKEEGSKKV